MSENSAGALRREYDRVLGRGGEHWSLEARDTAELDPIEPFYRRVMKILATEGPAALEAVWPTSPRETMSDYIDGIVGSLDRLIEERDTLRRCVLDAAGLRRAVSAFDALQESDLRLRRLLRRSGIEGLAELWDQVPVTDARNTVNALRHAVDGGAGAAEVGPLTAIPSPDVLAEELLGYLDQALQEGLLALEDRMMEASCPPVRAVLRDIAEAVPAEISDRARALSFDRVRRWSQTAEEVMRALVTLLAEGVAIWDLSEVLSTADVLVVEEDVSGDAADGDDADGDDPGLEMGGSAYDDEELEDMIGNAEDLTTAAGTRLLIRLVERLDDVTEAPDRDRALRTLPVPLMRHALRLLTGDAAPPAQKEEAVRRVFCDFRAEIDRAEAVILTGADCIRNLQNRSVARTNLHRYTAGEAALGPDPSLASFLDAVLRGCEDPRPMIRELETLLRQAEWVRPVLGGQMPVARLLQDAELPGRLAELESRLRAERAADERAVEAVRAHVAAGRTEMEKRAAREHPSVDTLHLIVDAETRRRLSAVLMQEVLDQDKELAAAEERIRSTARSRCAGKVREILGSEVPQLDIETGFDAARRIFPGGASALAKFMQQIARDDEERDMLLARAFVFEDIVVLDDRSIQKVLRELEAVTLATAMKGADAEVTAKIYRNMSRRAASLLREDIEYMGPIPARDVTGARDLVVETILGLEEAGDITIARSGGDELIV